MPSPGHTLDVDCQFRRNGDALADGPLRSGLFIAYNNIKRTSQVHFASRLLGSTI